MMRTVILILALLPAAAYAQSTAPATTQSREQTVAALIRQSRQLIIEQKYAQSLLVFDRICEIDPENEYALGVRQLVQDRIDLRAEGVSASDDGIRRPPPTTQQQEKRTAELLAKRLPEVKVDPPVLASVVAFLSDATGASIRINWPALEAAGIRKSAAVEVRLRDKTLAEALYIVLDSASDQPGKLGFWIDQGVITIDTSENVRLRSALATQPSQP